MLLILIINSFMIIIVQKFVIMVQSIVVGLDAKKPILII
jgi:hypothetical protein